MIEEWPGGLGERWDNNSMLITVTRTHKTSDGLFGNLLIDTSAFKCLTMENASLAILPGTYPIQWMWSEHFQQIMPQIIVPGRIAIEQHWANYPKQLNGCQALGTSVELSQNTLNNSKIAWVGYIKTILNQPNLILKVVEDYGSV